MEQAPKPKMTPANQEINGDINVVSKNQKNGPKPTKEPLHFPTKEPLPQNGTVFNARPRLKPRDESRISLVSKPIEPSSPDESHEPDESELKALEKDYASYEFPDAALNNSLRMYLTEIGAHKLLDPEEETTIFERVSRGDEEARQQATEANLRLAFSVAMRYAQHANGMPLEDLVQEANLGLLKAVEKFDIKKGYKFSTYATWWIRQSVTRAIADKSRLIRVPVHGMEVINRLARFKHHFLLEQGREPTQQELIDHVVKHAGGGTGKTITENTARLLIAQMNNRQLLSLDRRIDGSDEDSGTLGDIISAPDKDFDRDAPVLIKELLGFMEANLTERELTVMKRRLGFEDGERQTLEEIGTYFGVTRERIRQIEKKAKEKLKRIPSFSSIFE